MTDDLSDSRSMPRMTPQEAAHWSRAKAAWISTYRPWGKKKPNFEYVNSLADDAADLSLRSFRERQRRSVRTR
jgi:hypothetical protein